ncbi:hypothetical protein [Fluviispira sanaruensis]|uniref:Lipoprotein n=1 Tax=Fluviispira sanaruensis TaxID=2493639 RepID=A0A4P2VND5_FLUSA|nr:hypothetical protein [Fluviispira sanaruensis]BBH53089.1 hypothetical protein JCM31447_15320 [Fluviispira sanaruensis]
MIRFKLYILIILLFTYSCSNENNEKDKGIILDLSDIKLEKDILNSWILEKEHYIGTRKCNYSLLNIKNLNYNNELSLEMFFSTTGKNGLMSSCEFRGTFYDLKSGTLNLTKFVGFTPESLNLCNNIFLKSQSTKITYKIQNQNSLEFCFDDKNCLTYK